METTLTATADVPTALPDIEADEERANLLRDSDNDPSNDGQESDDLDAEESLPSNPGSSRVGKILKNVAVFTVFLFLIGLAVTWFFGMGWFAAAKPQPVDRSGQKEAVSEPMTEDEKLKVALTMVASKEPDLTRDPVAHLPEDVAISETPAPGVELPKDALPFSNTQTIGTPSITDNGTGNLIRQVSKPDVETPAVRNRNDKPEDTRSRQPELNTSIEPLGRSLFFGITKVRNQVVTAKDTGTAANSPSSRISRTDGQIPFGTLLPVRLAGAIYTLRNSGGVVRMELTQPVEGKGYSYPAGTTIVGNLRGGESVRAFVSVVGLIDPVSGELVKFTGELMGTDGASGISGKRKRITGKWTRFFRGLKDTAASLLGSVGAFRSGGTVILSEPLRRGSESLSEETSESLFGTYREDTFLEVMAGTSGYVLVTQLSEAATATNIAVTGAEKE